MATKIDGKTLGFFCENPKCRWHVVIGDPSQSLTMAVTYSPSYSPKYDSPTSSLTMKSQLTQEIRTRHVVVRSIDGFVLSGSFCSVCFEAIRLVEGMA